MFVFFIYKENDNITSCICLSHRSIHILRRAMPLFNKTKLWFVNKNLGDFARLNAMFPFKLLDNFIEPDNFFNSQLLYLCHQLLYLYHKIFHISLIFIVCVSIWILPLIYKDFYANEREMPDRQIRVHQSLSAVSEFSTDSSDPVRHLRTIRYRMDIPLPKLGVSHHAVVGRSFVRRMLPDLLPYLAKRLLPHIPKR